VDLKIMLRCACLIFLKRKNKNRKNKKESQIKGAVLLGLSRFLRKKYYLNAAKKIN
jgi:hypothetical protein